MIFEFVINNVLSIKLNLTYMACFVYFSLDARCLAHKL